MNYDEELPGGKRFGLEATDPQMSAEGGKTTLHQWYNMRDIFVKPLYLYNTLLKL